MVDKSSKAQIYWNLVQFCIIVAISKNIMCYLVTKYILFKIFLANKALAQLLQIRKIVSSKKFIFRKLIE